MRKDTLKLISDSMESIDLSYQFGQWSELPGYPYFVGEYQEYEQMNEDGLQDTTFILTGYSRTSLLELENAKDQIRQIFDPITGKRAIADNGAAAAVYYSNAQIIPTADAELKKIQINLDIKEWSEK